MLKPYCLGIMNKIKWKPKPPSTIHHLILRRSPSPTPAHFSALIDAIEADRDYWQICGNY
jgi:hypothetical protein